MSSERIRSIALVAALGSVAVFVLYGLGQTLVPLLVAFTLSYLFFPVIRRLESAGIPRVAAVSGVFVAVSLFLTIVLLLVIPELISDTKIFLAELPTNAQKALGKASEVAASFGVDIPLDKDWVMVFISDHVSSISGDEIKSVLSSFTKAFSGVSRWFIAALNLFLVPIFFFYLINDYERLTRGVLSFIPAGLQGIADRYLTLADRVLSGYIRGQMIVACVLGLLYGVGLMIVGLRFGILVGLMSGLISIIPYAGFAIGFAVALMLALANFTGMGTIAGVIIVFVVVQSLEGLVITPKLVGDKVGLNSFTTMLALIIGGNLLGLAGMLLAIPAAAIGKQAIIDLRTAYLQLHWVRPPQIEHE